MSTSPAESSDSETSEPTGFSAPVLILDDDSTRHTAQLVDGLRELDMTVEHFPAPEEFEERAMALSEPMILIVDHDLGRTDVSGYDVVRRLRRNHPFGLVIPVIYYSGKEDPSSFLERTGEEFAFAPNTFVKKGAAGANIFRTVEVAQRMLFQIVTLSATQSMQQAVLSPLDTFGLSDGDFL